VFSQGTFTKTPFSVNHLVLCGAAVLKKTALAVILVLTFIVPSVANAQTTTHYGRDSGINPAAFDITIYSPNNHTTYAEAMLLNFNMTWTTYPLVHTIEGPLNGGYSYTIDNNPPVTITSNQSAGDVFYVTPSNNFTINPYFSYIVDVSTIANGNHDIVLKATLFVGSYQYFNESTSPIVFSIQHPQPTPTPEDVSPMLFAGLVIVAIVAMAGLGLLVYLKKRHPKTGDRT